MSAQTTTHLRSVEDDEVLDAEDVREYQGTGPSRAFTVSQIPDFEGQPVDFTRTKLAAVSKMETGDSWHRIDDMVRMVVEGRIVNVTHVVDEATGKLMRVHTIKVADATEIPWDVELPGA